MGVKAVLGRYNLTPANRKTLKSGVYEFSGAFFSSAAALMGAGMAVEIERNMVSSMTARADLKHGGLATVNAEASMDAKAAAWFAVSAIGEMKTICEANMQRLLNDPMRMTCGTEAKAGLKMHVFWGGELFDALGALWNSEQIKETTMRFAGISIPPGGMVVIDSEFFTAALNGESIVDLYDGDWLMFNSSLKAIEARGTSSGKLDVEILYREMYL